MSCCDLLMHIQAVWQTQAHVGNQMLTCCHMRACSPWCYMGKLRLEKAMKQFKDQMDFEVKWLPFQLDANASLAGVDKLELYNSKFGAARVAQMIPHMTVRQELRAGAASELIPAPWRCAQPPWSLLAPARQRSSTYQHCLALPCHLQHQPLVPSPPTPPTIPPLSPSITTPPSHLAPALPPPHTHTGPLCRGGHQVQHRRPHRQHL
jgi:hypothetical protein